jgi:hypothetical protein
MMYLSTQRTSDTLYRRYAGNKSEPVDFYYNCGEYELSLQVDPYFIGNKNQKMLLIAENP